MLLAWMYFQDAAGFVLRGILVGKLHISTWIIIFIGCLERELFLSTYKAIISKCI